MRTYRAEAGWVNFTDAGEVHDGNISYVDPTSDTVRMCWSVTGNRLLHTEDKDEPVVEMSLLPPGGGA